MASSPIGREPKNGDVLGRIRVKMRCDGKERPVSEVEKGLVTFPDVAKPVVVDLDGAALLAL